MSKKQNEDLKYIPIITKVSKNNGESIVEKKPTVKISSNVDYPREQFGFHHFLHSSKNKTEQLLQFEGKKKVYLIMNRFERFIDNHDEGIEISTIKKFNLKEGDIIGRGFYKIWEIVTIFGIIPKDGNFSSAHLNETTGSFMQAVHLYRDTYSKKTSKNDKYHIDSDSNIDKKYANMLKSEKPNRLVVNKTFSDGDIDLITGNIELTGKNENIYEQNALKTVINQIITAVKIIKKGGTFICKVYETFTQTSMKITVLLNELFENIYFIKPLMSEPYSSEKFIVCTKYKYGKKEKQHKNVLDKMDIIKKEIDKMSKNMNIVDLFNDYKIPNEMVISMINQNNIMSNNQYVSINEIIRFVKKEIYFGEEYHERKYDQIEGAKYWTNMFYSGKEYPEVVESSTKKSKENENEFADILSVSNQ